MHLAFAAPIAAQPGQIHVEDHRLFVACAGKTWLELLEVQLEGKKRLAAAEFLRGNALAEGARLGTRRNERARKRQAQPRPRRRIARRKSPQRARRHFRFCWRSSAANRTPTICCAAKPSTRSPLPTATWPRRWCWACCAGRFSLTSQISSPAQSPQRQARYRDSDCAAPGRISDCCTWTAFPRAPRSTKAWNWPSRPAIASPPAWSTRCCASWQSRGSNLLKRTRARKKFC